MRIMAIIFGFDLERPTSWKRCSGMILLESEWAKRLYHKLTEPFNWILANVIICTHTSSLITRAQPSLFCHVSLNPMPVQNNMGSFSKWSLHAFLNSFIRQDQLKLRWKVFIVIIRGDWRALTWKRTMYFRSLRSLDWTSSSHFK